MDNNNKPKNDNNKKPNANSDKNILRYLLIAVLLTFVVNMVLQSLSEGSTSVIDYSEFVNMIENDEVKRVEFSTDKYKIIPFTDEELAEKNGTVPTPTPSQKPTSEMTDQEKLQAYLNQKSSEQTLVYYVIPVNQPELISLLEKHNVEYTAIYTNNALANFFVQWILPFLFIYIIAGFMMNTVSKKMGGGGFMNVGKSNAKLYLEQKTGVTFADVAGQEEAKESLLEIVDYLHNPKKYVDIGAKQPKGALLVGPPGTGKTLLAKAVAGEANVAFFSLSGSDFIEMYVGVGASRVRNLFKEANEHAPCIIFIDEIDAIGKSRDSQHGGHDEREQTLNQLLSEMDGFDSSKGVVILGATNRPEILDKALLRPGRFDRRVVVEKPDLPGRLSILEVHAKKIRLAPNVKLKEIAQATSGAVGADLANMINEAAIRAVRLGRKEVIQEDIMESVEVVIAGKEKKDRILSEKERRIVAYHEVGHALCSVLQKHTTPVQKITIVPRTMGALGYTMQVPEEEKYLMSKEEMIADIVTFLGGRCAEVLEFDVETSGASNDIERSTNMARTMITQYGMSEKFGMMGLQETTNRYLDARRSYTCSETTAALVDEEVNKIMKECYQTAMSLLSENREMLTKISEYLLKKETITGEIFMKLYNNEEVIEFTNDSEEISIFEYMNKDKETVEIKKETVNTNTSIEEKVEVQPTITSDEKIDVPSEETKTEETQELSTDEINTEEIPSQSAEEEKSTSKDDDTDDKKKFNLFS